MYQERRENYLRVERTGWLGKSILKKGVLFLAILLLCFFTPITAHAEKKVVKIGAVAGSDFVEEYGGVYRGYGAEYMQQIAHYNDWTYVYVFDTLENIFQRLESGELDMICNIQKTEERSKKYLYSEIPLGYDYTVIYTRPDSDIYYEDYEAMKGKKVGLLTASAHSDNYLKYERVLELDSEPVYYEYEDEVMTALQVGAVDMAVVASLYNRDDMKAVARFGTSPFYCITRKTQKGLMGELNEALQNIKVENPGIEAELAKKYYGNSQISSSPLFTREESEYIAKREPVRIRLMVGSQPLSYIDAELNPQGIFVEYLKLLEEKSGLQFIIELSVDSLGMEEQTTHIKDGDYLMLRAQRALEASGLEENLITTKPVITTQLAYVINKDNAGDLGRDDYVFAVTKEMGYFEDLIKQVSENYQVKYYPDTESCLNAVLRKEADIAAQDSYIVTYLLQKPKYAEHLVERPGREYTNGMCLIASEDEEMLVQILDKTISYITDQETDNIVSMELLMNPYKLKFADILYRYWQLLLCIVMILFVSAATYTILMQRMTKLQLQKKEYELLQKKVLQDELTGVYNRPAFFKKARKMIDNAQDEMCIVLLDLDNFKVINDLYGIRIGDKLLKHMADELTSRCKGKDVIISRFNSDHFYMCMKTSDFEELKFPKRYKTFLEDMDITAMYGVFPVGDKKDVPLNIMCDRASLAAHDANRSRGEYIRFYSEDERKRLIREQEIVNDMEKALEGRQFSVYIQPKYNIIENRIVGGEALVRWFHPQKGMVSPGDFIPVFEKNGLIIPLDYYVWEETCRVVSELKKKGFPTLPISVNVSRAHFYGKELREKLEELINKYDLTMDDIELEITETICAEDPEIIYKKVRELQDAGFKIAMDDFGSGYSSLNMLKEMPLDTIKMDLKFLDGGDDEEKSRTILGTLINLAQSMKLYVVMEGVETEEQVKFLQGIGTPCAQGYFYSRPVDCDTYESMLVKEREK